MKTKQKQIYLTFDDGPIPEVTEWILDVLTSFQVKATFFCVGDNIRKHPDIFRKVIHEGHSVGNHTFNHIKGWKTNDKEYYANIRQWEETVRQQGIVPGNNPIFRPPYGQITFNQVRHLKKQYEIIMWDIITGDFDKSLDKQHCLEKSVALTRPGTIIVFHDSLKAQDNLEFILPAYIQTMKNYGYSFARW